MPPIQRIDTTNVVLDISRDLSVTCREKKPGPPERIDGMTVGVVTIEPGQSPHNGEMHPDGDEVLYVIQGTLCLTYDSGNEPLYLTSGEACIVPKGEWHMVDCTERTTIMHITPGPNGEARFNLGT